MLCNIVPPYEGISREAESRLGTAEITVEPRRSTAKTKTSAEPRLGQKEHTVTRLAEINRRVETRQGGV